MTTTDNVFKEAMTLRPFEKAKLIDKLLASLVGSDKEIDKFWAEEAENRVNAYNTGKIKEISLEEVLQKYK